MDEVRNNFTRFLDKYRINSIMDMESPYKEMMSTYLWGPDIEDDFTYTNGVLSKHIVFRLPGATRGHIVVDKDYIINDIVFYGDTCFSTKNNGIECYKPGVAVDAIKQFRGTKLDLENIVVGDKYLEEISD